MADINLPVPGEDPNWGSKLNTAILAVNQDVDQLNNNLEDEVRDIAADVIASDPTIVQAAEEAVDDALASGRVMQETGPGTNLDDLQEVSGVIIANTQTTGTPFSGGFMVLHERYDADRASQFAIHITSGRLYVRVRFTSGWGEWAEIPRIPDLVVDGLIAQKCVHLEDGAWVWDGPSGPLATHYVLPDHTGALVVRSTPFPTPGSAPELNW